MDNNNRHVHLHAILAILVFTVNVSNLISVPFISTDLPQLPSRCAKSMYSNDNFWKMPGALGLPVSRSLGLASDRYKSRLMQRQAEVMESHGPLLFYFTILHAVSG